MYGLAFRGRPFRSGASQRPSQSGRSRRTRQVRGPGRPRRMHGVWPQSEGDRKERTAQGTRRAAFYARRTRYAHALRATCCSWHHSPRPPRRLYLPRFVLFVFLVLVVFGKSWSCVGDVVPARVWSFSGSSRCCVVRPALGSFGSSVGSGWCRLDGSARADSFWSGASVPLSPPSVPQGESFSGHSLTRSRRQPVGGLRSVRFLCPITCGCSHPTSGLLQQIVQQGCPWACLSQLPAQMAGVPCADGQDIPGAPSFAIAWSRLWGEVPPGSREKRRNTHTGGWQIPAQFRIFHVFLCKCWADRVGLACHDSVDLGKTH